ncbi:MAG: hypothetical protein JXR39_10390 [Marinilabiliaceae bacterium]|nr:hypothetical protein [Marinilabiliaceae bacterium]
MRLLVLIFFSISGAVSLMSQTSFYLAGDGNWHRVAYIGGHHAYFSYQYTHPTGHNPSIVKGDFLFINAKSYIIQNQHTMGYGQWNQPQFAILNFGDYSELWVRPTKGVATGVFRVSESLNAVLLMDDLIDSDLSDNGAQLKIYDKLPDDSHVYSGNMVVMDGNMGIGVSSPEHPLEVNGIIRAKEIRVDASPWPDYVFGADYPLRDLVDVKAYIANHHRLPDLPAAEVIEENGVDLSQMNMLLLKKIEELTLYILMQQEQIENQDRDIQVKSSCVDKLLTNYQLLNQRIDKLEKQYNCKSVITQ